jgi:hypothetical protein
MRQLKTLDINANSLSVEALKQLQESLPGCTIRW